MIRKSPKKRKLKIKRVRTEDKISQILQESKKNKERMTAKRKMKVKELYRGRGREEIL